MATPSATLCAEIMSGEYDGKLADVLAAIVRRQQDGATAMRWRITFDGLALTEDDLTMAEAKTVEKITGRSWAVINPWQTAADCSAIIVAAVHHREGVPLDEAEGRVDSRPMQDIVSAIEQYEVTPAPLGSTPGSTPPTGTDAG